jgi:hypothetical protein
MLLGIGRFNRLNGSFAEISVDIQDDFRGFEREISRRKYGIYVFYCFIPLAGRDGGLRGEAGK